MKKLITICLLLATTVTITAQVNFEVKHLAILEKIAFTTSYKTIKSFMNDTNYTFQEEIDNEITLKNDDFLKVIYLEFKGPIGNSIMVCYKVSDKTFLLVVNQIASLNTVFCEIELEEENFIINLENENGKSWSKSSYKYQIVTDKSDEKTHNLIFLSPSHPEFIK